MNGSEARIKTDDNESQYSISDEPYYLPVADEVAASLAGLKLLSVAASFIRYEKLMPVRTLLRRIAARIP